MEWEVSLAVAALQDFLLYQWDPSDKNAGGACNAPATIWQQEFSFWQIQLYLVVYLAFTTLGIAGG